MKKALLLFLAFSLFSCQKKEEKYSSPPLPMEAAVLNNKITSKYVNIPNTKIYIEPFDNNYKLSNGAMVASGNDYSLTVMETANSQNTVNDFTKEGLEAKGVKVFDEKNITVNGINSKIIFLQGQPQIKGGILFIDDKSEKVMITAMYDANNLSLENKIKNLLYGIVYKKDLKVDYLKNATFILDTKETKFKFNTYNANSYIFTEEGKNAKISDPTILVLQTPKIEDTDLKNYLSEAKKSFGNYGMENIEEKNILETKNSLQFELHGKLKGNSSVILYKILKDPKKDFILMFMASSKQNTEQDLAQFKKIANTFSFK